MEFKGKLQLSQLKEMAIAYLLYYSNRRKTLCEDPTHFYDNHIELQIEETEKLIKEIDNELKLTK